MDLSSSSSVPSLVEYNANKYIYKNTYIYYIKIRIYIYNIYIYNINIYIYIYIYTYNIHMLFGFKYVMLYYYIKNVVFPITNRGVLRTKSPNDVNTSK